MLLNGKLITEIEENDLASMIGVASESQNLDFKEHAYPTYQDQNGKTTWDKVEFCADLSSFANSFGGWIICGMKEKGGMATEICGLGPTINIEREIQRLEQAANSGIEPRLPTLKFQSVDLADPEKSKVLLIYVGRSFIGPHRVKETSKFHARRSNGKNEMNVDELRIAFNLAESLTERVKNFRQGRVGILNSSDVHEDVPVVLEHGPRIILHSIPLTTLSLGTLIELNSFEFANNVFSDVSQLNAFFRGARFNFLGVVFPFGLKIAEKTEYFQVFRNGSVEYVSVLDHGDLREKTVNPFRIEQKVLMNLSIILKMQKSLGVDSPTTIMLSLIGLNDYSFELPGLRNAFEGVTPISQERILFPDVILTDYEQNLKTVLRPLLNIFWNTGGFSGSASYDEDGNWIG